MTGRMRLRARPPSRAVRAGSMRRTRPVKRASAGLSPVRAGAVLAMLLSAFAVYGVGASPVFEFGELRIEGATYTDPLAVQRSVEPARGENLFRLSTAPLVAELRDIPTVADARIGIALPGTLVVTLDEREPVLVWKVGSQRYLVDRDGLLVGRLGDDAPPEAEQLPAVVDERARSSSFGVGQRLDPVDVDAATRLASLTPAQIASSAGRLAVVVTDDHGFELRAQPKGWTAIFGFYTPSLRRTDIIPGQVRLLSRLLEGREAEIASIVLADEHDGTYIPKPSPTSSAEPE
jgi:cell division septal protein FtsQ